MRNFLETSWIQLEIKEIGNFRLFLFDLFHENSAGKF